MDSRGLLPNLLIPGVAKSGTSSLAWYLSQHPDVCPGDRKEIDYFTPLRNGLPPLGSLEDYGRHFSHYAGQAYRLDASVHYFDGGRSVVDAIHGHLGEPRSIIALRNPVERLWSCYRHKLELGKLDPTVTFRSFFETCRALSSSGEDRLYQWRKYRDLAVGNYIDTLRHWFEVFDDGVQIVFLEHFSQDPHLALRKLCAWLEIDSSPVDDFDFPVRNKTIAPRSLALNELAEAVNLRVDRHFHRFPKAKSWLRSAYAAVNAKGEHEGLSPQDRAMVGEYYEPANRALLKELVRRGYRDVPRWMSGVPG